MLSNSQQNQLLHISFWLPSFRFRSLWQGPGFAVVPDAHIAVAFPPLCPKAVCCFFQSQVAISSTLPAKNHVCALPNPWQAGRQTGYTEHKGVWPAAGWLYLIQTDTVPPSCKVAGELPWELKDKLEAKNICRQCIRSHQCTSHFRGFLRSLAFFFYFKEGIKLFLNYIPGSEEIYSNNLKYLFWHFEILWLYTVFIIQKKPQDK